ncbi:hypothetical protein CAEBREN_28611 [Caenorhabditis brenneri]|uniref:CX domain-containing protein n=1 Tax=Caenorhabditis brenneri TaxID=135651 RepID=G0MXR6_CAEBE|nr:hypothetical protein CAEBREN_28611 [Caenorhabditis brenneri]
MKISFVVSIIFCILLGIASARYSPPHIRKYCTDKPVRFSDGSPVKSIMFGCWKHQRCCGTECCFETFIFTCTVLFLLLAGIFILIRSIVKEANEIPLNEVDIPLNERQ